MEVKVIHSPSGLQVECISSRLWRVSRLACPPSADTHHKSPPQEKTTSVPSGLMDGKRGNFTSPLSASAEADRASQTNKTDNRAATGLNQRMPDILWPWFSMCDRLETRVSHRSSEPGNCKLKYGIE